MSDQKRLWLVFGYTLALAAAVLFLCSRSSPGYVINDWCDANIYLSIGKGMTRGLVVYRDLYDHKGPLLFMLHAVAALISFRDFFGVYLLEVVQAAFFLFYSWRILRLYGLRRSVWVLVPLLALAVYASYSFAEGDSAEEMCLPLMTAQLFLTLRYFYNRQEGRPMSRGGLIACGVLAGCVFWIKFTIIGLPAGLLLAILLPFARKGGWKTLWQSLGWMVAGAFVSTVPWLVYFGLNGAIYDWLKVYLGHNLFLYGTAQSLTLQERLATMVYLIWDWIKHNAQYALLVFAGPAWLSVSRKGGKGAARAAWLMLGCGVVTIFIGAKGYLYYGLALAAVAPIGLAAAGTLLEPVLSRFRARWAMPVTGAAFAAGCVALCLAVSPNVHPESGLGFGAKREDSMQFRIVDQMEINDQTTLLNFGFMDAGFYTAAGIAPSVKYFHQNNVPLREMKTEQRRYVEEGLCEYVVTRNPNDTLFARYDQITHVESPQFWYERVYLYRLKPEYR